ncbi:MAG TPA: CDGSH iron-sulfur domain-containing protein [Candidatus Paceibacterota bacterium]|nr:CDGSH iron-sulfur domain-containing protein [Candidatus Paceibacterota bacterium]
MDKDLNTQRKIKITKDGPYVVSGNIPLDKETILTDEKGCSYKWEKGEKYPQQENYSLCRCGQSKHKPYCDGSHASVHFDGTETASTKPYNELAQTIEGPGLDLKDVRELCASARFCDREEGAWALTQEFSGDPEAKKLAIEECGNCPSGRLVAIDKETGQPIEPKFEPSISLVEDPEAKVSGPLWVKGGIKVESARGENYESRNRVTLCRCGKSHNKPYCDGSHIKVKFNDGLN